MTAYCFRPTLAMAMKSAASIGGGHRLLALIPLKSGACFYAQTGDSNPKPILQLLNDCEDGQGGKLRDEALQAIGATS